MASAKLKNAPEGTIVTISWHYDNGGIWYEIDKVSITNKNMNKVKSTLSSPTTGWPTGNYRVFFSLNTDNSEPLTKNFTIN